MFYVKKYYHYLIRKFLEFYILLFKKTFDKVVLKDVLTYCSKNIDFYRQNDPDLNHFRYIDNETVKKHFQEFVKKGTKASYAGFTSGTTGIPGKFLRDLNSIAGEQYFQNDYFKWNHKFKIIFRGEQLFRPDEKPQKIFKTVPFLKEMYISSYHINDENLKGVVQQLKTIRSKCLWAYPSSAFLLAEYCLNKNEEIEFDIVATSSEMISDHQINTIEKAFKCKVKDWYGQAERVSALYRCEQGHYHEVKNYSHMEYLPLGENTYEIVGTTLHNRVMPLVRYRTGDSVEISPESCLCKAPGVNIVKITGRQSNFVALNEKKIPECLFSCLMKKNTNICQFQIVQNKSGKIIYRVVKNKSFDKEDEKLLLNTLYDVIPRESCAVEYVDTIKRDKNGKLRFVIVEKDNQKSSDSDFLNSVEVHQ